MNKQRNIRLLHSISRLEEVLEEEEVAGIWRRHYHTIPLGCSRGRNRYKVKLALLMHVSSAVWHTPIVHGGDRYLS